MEDSDKQVESSAAKDLLLLLNPRQEEEQDIGDGEPKQQQQQEEQRQEKLDRKKESARLSRQRRREQLEKLKENQCRGITILLTDATGKILTHKLSNESDYIDFISATFDSYKLSKQIIDYKILKGEQPDL